MYLGLFFLSGIQFLIPIAVVIFIFYKFSKLGARIERLEKLNHINNGEPASSGQSPAKTPEKSPEKPLAVPLPLSDTENPQDIESLFKWFAVDWQLKTGALFILLGFLWFVTYAFLHNWIGPVGRITLGLITGALVLHAGEMRLRFIRNQGITIVWLGSGIMIVSIYAAQYVYHMFPALVALGLILITIILTTTVSLKHKSLSLSLASLVIGGLAPMLINAPEPNIVRLYTYLFVVVTGTIWVVKQSGWRILTFLSLVIVTIHSMQYFLDPYNALTLTPLELLTLETAAVTFTSLFYFASLLPFIESRKVKASDLVVACAVGLFALAWINSIVHKEYQGLISMIAAVAFSCASYFISLKTHLKYATFLYTAIAIILLAAATGYQMNGPVMVIAFAFQAMLLPIIGVHLLGVDLGKYILFYFILPVLFSLEYIGSDLWSIGLFQNAFYALFVVTICLFATSLYFYYNKKEDMQKLHGPSVFMIIVASIYGLVLIWKVFHVQFSPDYIARMVILITYSMIGLIAYAYGEIKNRKVLDRFGLAVLIFVVGWLLLYEVWNMELTWRIVTFFAVGTLFIGSVLLKKIK